METNVRKILIADPAPFLHSAYRLVLKYHDCETIGVAGGWEALQTLKSVHVDLVVADTQMPPLNGVQLLINIRRKYPRLPVIITSGFPTPEVEALSMANGAFAYIAKPFDIGLFVETVQKALA